MKKGRIKMKKAVKIFAAIVLVGIALTSTASATILGTAAFLRSDLAFVFMAANALTAVAWSFLIPYFFGMCSDFDPAGQSATLAGFFSKMGLELSQAVE